MAVRIGTAPRGLLGALQAKIGGINPPDLGQTVVPTIDVYDQYLADQLAVQSVTGNVAIGAANVQLTDTVPQGQIWRVLGLTVGIVLNVADVALVDAGFCGVRLPAPSPVVNIVTQWGAAGDTLRYHGSELGKPIWLFPGWQLVYTARLNGVTTVAAPVVGAALIQRIAE